MELLIAVITFLAGTGTGAVILWRILPARRKQHTDYKQRWEDAVRLLGSQGQLTDEQVGRLFGKTAGARKGAPRLTQHQLCQLPSWDRKDIEIARARAGLHPADDLRGMVSWDVSAVLRARVAAELRNAAAELRDSEK